MPPCSSIETLVIPEDVELARGEHVLERDDDDSADDIPF